ncbi:hypothetical protein SKAU_G00098830 [Synaphobranchus kaupii]|uniref:Uncharacterized protein n=1 Tax=Synaphobranchus kaupii TaxID=118154 RepID=A0A9Q1J524_SYNKA|nr:hypothetical protein SKAU_G00098830 [Synaphobranchus kaupii]
MSAPRGALTLSQSAGAPHPTTPRACPAQAPRAGRQAVWSPRAGTQTNTLTLRPVMESVQLAWRESSERDPGAPLPGRNGAKRQRSEVKGCGSREVI